MRFIFDMLKGMVMGIANVIPGVSGGTMAVAMCIYDKLIHALTHLFKEFKKSIITVLPIGIGMLVGIVGLSMLIEWMFGVIPIQTNMLFIGLIIGGVPVVWDRVKKAKKGPGHYLGFVIFMALVIGLSFVQAGTEKAKAAMDKDEIVAMEESAEQENSDVNIVDCVVYLGAGIVAAATMVIPGVSGSMMLMVMGLYEKVISSISILVKALAAGDFAAMKEPVFILLPFGIGCVIGIFAIAKLIEILLKKCPIVTFMCIMGLIIGSPVAIVVVNFDIFAKINAISLITGIVAMAVGVIIALLLGKENDETADEKAVEE